MSKILLADSFDHYANTSGGGQGFRKWNGGSSLTIDAGGRNGNCGMQNGLGSYGASHTFTQGVQQTVQCGFAWKPGTSNSRWPLTFGNAQSGWSISFLNTSDGRIYAQISAGSHSYWTTDPTGDATSWVQQGGIWYYVQVQVNVTNGTSGGNTTVIATYTAKVNGVQVLSAVITGLFGAVIPTGWVSVSYIQMGGPGDGSRIDDLVVTDGEFLGDVTVSVLRPISDGASSQWTPLSGPDHFAMIHETNSDDDTSYLLDSGDPAGDIDYWNLTQIPGSPQILGVQALWCVKNDVTGDSTLQGEYRNGAGTVHDAAVTYPSSADSYNYYVDALRKSPFTGSDFTAAEVNAMQLGLKRVA